MTYWINKLYARFFNSVKYYYLPGPEYNTHFNIYYEWVRTATDHGLPVTLLYITPYENYREHRKEIRERSRMPFVKVVVLPDFKYGIFLTLYLTYITFCCRTVFHARKFNIHLLRDLRKKRNGRMRLLYELEGDVVSEVEFLRSNPNRYASYDAILSGNDEHATQKCIIENNDVLSVVSSHFKAIIVKRYSEDIKENNIVVFPTCGKEVYVDEFDESKREYIRKKYGYADKYVVNYTGNLFFTWAQFDRCLVAFKMIKEFLCVNAHFLAIVPLCDHEAAVRYFEDHSIDKSDYTLIEVKGDQLVEMLLASDVGLLLRPNHVSMLCGSPGKFCDYVSSGLPVLMTEYVGDYSAMVAKDKLFPIVRDISSDAEILRCASILSKYEWHDRMMIAKWAQENILTNVYTHKYTTVLKGLGLLTNVDIR